MPYGPSRAVLSLLATIAAATSVNATPTNVTFNGCSTGAVYTWDATGAETSIQFMGPYAGKNVQLFVSFKGNANPKIEIDNASAGNATYSISLPSSDMLGATAISYSRTMYYIDITFDGTEYSPILKRFQIRDTNGKGNCTVAP